MLESAVDEREALARLTKKHYVEVPHVSGVRFSWAPFLDQVRRDVRIAKDAQFAVREYGGRRQPYEELVLPLAREKGMGILAMKVRGGGLGSLAEGNPIANDGASNHDEASRQASTAELIRYVLGLPVSAAVIGMGSFEELRVNVQTVRQGQPLGKIQRQALRKLMAGVVGDDPRRTETISRMGAGP